MRLAARLLAVLSLCLATERMPAQTPAAAVAGEGVYQSRTMEVGSQLILSPSGRFLWVFSYGALDLAGEGRWSREADGTIVLNSDPPVEAPRFELVGRSHDDRPGVAVRLTCDSRQAADYLNPVVEYADGERIGERFSELEYRSDTNPPRPVAAVYVGSLLFDLMSERFPVNPQEANVLTFRFVPNDLGRVDFRSERLRFENGALVLARYGRQVRYVREGSAAGEEHRLPPVPRSAPDAAPAAVEVALDEPFPELEQRAAGTLTAVPGEGLMIARGPVDLTLALGETRFPVGRVLGGTQPLMITEAGGDGVVGGMAFAFPGDRLSLADALARAQALQQSLAQAGFRPVPESERMGSPGPFTTMPSDGSEGVSASDWADAERRLADEGQAITAMELYELRSGRHQASVRLENERRHERLVCPHSDWTGEAGREWRLLVTISPFRSMVEEEAQPQ
jgi:hypothetical protein